MMTEHLPGRTAQPLPSGSGLPEAPRQKRKSTSRLAWGVVLGSVSLIGGAALAYTFAVGSLSGLIPAQYTFPYPKGVAHSTVHAKGQPSTAQNLPTWVELGVLNITEKLDSANSQLESARKKLASAQASITSLENGRTRLQKTVGNLTAENMQLKAQLRQAEQAAANAKLARLGNSVSRPSPGNSPTLAATPASGPNGIVALARKVAASPKGAKGAHPAPAVTAKGWLTIAVHGNHAVVQTPAGQVALVHVGSRLDGAQVTRIDAHNKAVVLNHQQWVYPPK